jgi:hypothetical protein
VRTDYVLERTLLGLLSDEERKDMARSAEATAAEVLAATISENDPASPRYQAGLRDHIRKDRRSIVVTEIMSNILAPTNGLAGISGLRARGGRIDP